MRRVYPDHIEPYENKLGAEDLLGALIYGDIHHQLVDKLISRKAYEKGVIFPQANLCEDIPITIQLAYNSSSWGYLDETLYNYRFSPQSITAAPSSKATSAQVQSNIALTLSFLESKGLSRKYRKNIRHMKCWTRFTALPLPRKEYMAVYPEVNLAILLDSRFTVKERLGHLTKMLGIHGISKLFSKR
ncbi:MAG: hypothetical protein J6Z27_04850 [Bacteroidales bacterium]|nr:hypothetical protein [Bacteroidales bacterium]